MVFTLHRYIFRELLKVFVPTTVALTLILSLGSILVSWKVFAIVFFIFMASPTATHAITKAALIVGVEPWLRKKRGRK